MKEITAVSTVKSYGFGNTILAARFTPNASFSQTTHVAENWGFRSIVRNSTGLYTFTLADKVPGFVVMVSAAGQEDDTTTYHVVRVESQTATTFQISHKSVAFASVASGPTLSDTVDAITVICVARGQ